MLVLLLLHPYQIPRPFHCAVSLFPFDIVSIRIFRALVLEYYSRYVDTIITVSDTARTRAFWPGLWGITVTNASVHAKPKSQTSTLPFYFFASTLPTLKHHFLSILRDCTFFQHLVTTSLHIHCRDLPFWQPSTRSGPRLRALLTVHTSTRPSVNNIKSPTSSPMC